MAGSRVNWRVHVRALPTEGSDTHRRAGMESSVIMKPGAQIQGEMSSFI